MRQKFPVYQIVPKRLFSIDYSYVTHELWIIQILCSVFVTANSGYEFIEY